MLDERYSNVAPPKKKNRINPQGIIDEVNVAFEVLSNLVRGNFWPNGGAYEAIKIWRP